MSFRYKSENILPLSRAFPTLTNFQLQNECNTHKKRGHGTHKQVLRGACINSNRVLTKRVAVCAHKRGRSIPLDFRFSRARVMTPPEPPIFSPRSSPDYRRSRMFRNEKDALTYGGFFFSCVPAFWRQATRKLCRITLAVLKGLCNTW